MITTSTTYGICLTDDFGYPLDGMDQLLNAVKAAAPDLYLPRPWLVTCPSDEDQQVVVGISASIDKSTDFAQLHQAWTKAIAQAPDAIRTLLKGHEPDVHFLAGHC